MSAGIIEHITGFYETVGFSDAYMHLYLARQLQPVAPSDQLARDFGESFDIIELSFDDMQLLFEQGKINDQKTLTAFLYWSYIRG